MATHHHHIDITMATGGRGIEVDERRKGREKSYHKRETGKTPGSRSPAREGRSGKEATFEEDHSWATGML